MKRDEKKSVPESKKRGGILRRSKYVSYCYGLRCGLLPEYGGITYFEEAKEYFGLGKEDRLIGFLHVGMPRGLPPQGRRKPVNEKVYG